MKYAKKQPQVYLEDMLGAIARIGTYTQKGEHDFFTDEKTQDAVIRQLSIIGEASARLPKDMKDIHTDIPWKNIISMRNIMIHDYAQTDLPTVWNTIQKSLPTLQEAIERMLRELQ